MMNVNLLHLSFGGFFRRRKRRDNIIPSHAPSVPNATSTQKGDPSIYGSPFFSDCAHGRSGQI
jgi:hypothetical protein